MTSKDSFVSPGRANYVASHVSTFVILIANVITYRLCAQFLSDEGFAEYAVGRRTLSYGLPLVAFGVGVALSYHVARCTDEEKDSDGVYLLSATLVSAVLLFPLLALALAFPESSSFLFFGSGDKNDLIPSLVLTLLGMAAVNQCNAFLVGKMAIVRSALLLVLSSLLPLAIIVLIGGSAKTIFFYQGVALLILAVFGFLLFVNPLIKDRGLDKAAFRRQTQKLWNYGLPRVPGAFAASALLALPVTMTAHQSDDLIVAGVLSVGSSLMTVAGAVVNPFSVILLPQSSRLLSTGRGDVLKKQVWKLALVIACLLIPAVLLVGWQLKPLMAFYLNEKIAARSDVLLWLLPATLPYAYFRCFRSVVDGAYRRAYNTLNSLIALVVFGCWLGLAQLMEWPQPPLQALLVAMIVLGAATLYRVAKIFSGKYDSATDG